MAEARQKARNPAYGRRDFRIDSVAIRRFVGEGDAELTRIAADFLRKRPFRRRRHVGARRLGTVDRVHHDSAVAYADAHDVAAGEATPAFAAIGAEWITRPGRLQAEHAGRGGGDPDRAAAIAGMRDREDAGGNGRCRATRRPTGRMLEIPGIAGRPVQARLRRRHQAEFGTGALAEDRDASIEKALRQRAAVVGHKVLQDRGAGGRARALQEVEVLQEERYAGKGAVGQPALDLAFGIVVMLYHDRVDLRIDLRGTGDGLVEQFPGRDFFLPNQFGKADRVVIAVFLEGHADTSLADWSVDRPRPGSLTCGRFSRAHPD